MSDDEAADPTRRTVVGLASGVVAAMAAGPAAGAIRTPYSVSASDLTGMDAVTLAGTIKSGRASSVEVMTAFLDRIDQANPAVNAIVALQPREGLLAQAREADAKRSRGEPLGLLHGLPHAVKDLQSVKGIVSTRGSPIFKDFVPTADAPMVERLRKAGALIIGKTNTPEFGLGSHTYNAVYGLTRNPYDLSKSAGGSSGGAAVALATRMLPLADGSDFGGSLRNPAGWNNVLGFRPSFGRVAGVGDELWFPGMGVNGPMARSVPDLALLLTVQSGHDDRAPLSMEAASVDFTGQLSADLRGKRIGWLGDFGGAAPCEPGLLDVCRTALKTFEALGCIVEDVQVDMPIEPVWAAMLKLRAWQAGGGILDLYNDPARRALLKPEAIFEVESALRLSAMDVRAASVVRTQWYNAVRRLFQRYDYLIAPTAQVFPFDAAQDWPHEIAGQPMQTYIEWQKAQFLITMTGCPALAVPAGFSGAAANAPALPIGLQIVAPVWRERACLQLAHAYMQATDWVKRRPPPEMG